jgi:hypothetical protein
MSRHQRNACEVCFTVYHSKPLASRGSEHLEKLSATRNPVARKVAGSSGESFVSWRAFPTHHAIVCPLISISTRFDDPIAPPPECRRWLFTSLACRSVQPAQSPGNAITSSQCRPRRSPCADRGQQCGRLPPFHRHSELYGSFSEGLPVSIRVGESPIRTQGIPGRSMIWTSSAQSVGV